MRDIKKIIVHCSDTPEDMFVTVDTIRRWHVEDNGWSDIGYHFVIHRSGVIRQGRPLEKAGAHTRGHNKDSIGVCLIGRDKFTEKQKLGLKNIHRVIQGFVPDVKVFGHYEFDSGKTCPNFNPRELIL